MDDHTTTPSEATPPAARTAEALRELQERTRAALAAQRARMGNLESQLTEQLNSITAAIADQASPPADGSVPAAASLEEIARLQAELEATRSAWNAERDAWQAERASLATSDGDRANSLDQRQADLESRQQTLDERAAELNHRDRELRQRQELLDSYAAQCAGQQSQLTEGESNLQREREALAASQSELRASQTLVEHQQQELAANEQEFAAEREVWERDMSALRTEHREAVEERDDLKSALDASHAELRTARVHAGAADERDELRQKFELALEDMQRLRGRVTDLEQELASRPAADQTDSVELVHVRAERDALALRVAELEQQSVAPVDGDAAQEMADLQRRFELAVEDVRDLKKQNSQLEAELAEARARTGKLASTPVAESGGGGSSWELMKRQMLANLEDEIEDGEVPDEVRQKERTTIENTIHITDEVIANKDREIAELKAQMAEGGVAAAIEDDKIREMVDADEVVRQHRERIAQLEQEMEGKLRAAELELSVERAKIAREQSQLADLRAELDSQRNQGKYGAAAAPGQPPKRRWLSKLGLSGEEE